MSINLTGPLMDAMIASVTTGTTATLTVGDIDATIARLDQHGGTQSLTVTGNIVTGVFLGSSFSLQLITTNKNNTMKTTQQKLQWLTECARSNRLNLSFSKAGRVWVCKDSKGRQIWGGSLNDMRRLADGKLTT